MPSPFQTTAQRKQNALPWLLLVLVLAVLGAVMAAAQWRDHREVERAEREQLRTQVRVADELLTTQIESADAALRTMLDSMERWRGPNGYLPFAHEHLQRVAKMMPGARTFAVFDTQGVCQLCNRGELLGKDFSKRDYFQQAAADRSGAKLHIPPPYETVLGVWTVTISRAIIRPNGQFGGVVVATLSPDYFESLLKDLRYAPDMRLSLVHDSAKIYVTSPPTAAIYGTNRATGSNFLQAHLHAGQPESEHTGIGLDGTQRMAMTRTIGLANLNTTHGFVAVASRDVDAVFAPWRSTSLMLLWIWLAVAVLSAWALLRHQRSAAALGKKALVAEQSLRYSNARFEQLAHTIPCMLFDYDVSASGAIRVTYVGPYSQTLVGIAPEVLLTDHAQYVQRIHEEDRPAYQAIVDGAITTRMGYECEYRFWLPTGELRWLKTSATPGTSTKGSDTTHFSGFVIDVTDTKNQHLRLREMAYQDPLTQADNRRSFLEKLQAEIARVQRYGEEASLLMLDIDFFKQVNDIHGHLVGDTVLKHLVTVLQANLRSVDSLGRLGGEEFAVLLPDTSPDAAMQLAERLRQSVQTNPATDGELVVPFTVSVGVVAITASTADIKTVLHLADKAMYQAKRTGRNKVCSAADAPDTDLSKLSDALS